MVQICAVGEVMVELAPAGIEGCDGLRALNYAGDTYNTAVYLARLGVSTRYFTRLGDDIYSNEVLQIMHREGLDSSAIERAAGRTPGLYMIANHTSGERSFTFWRGQSPAREMFANIESTEAFARCLEDAEYAYFSGVTLGILAPAALQRLLQVLSAFRAKGGKVVFDGNYRPQLWHDCEHAQEAMMSALRESDIALLTDEDEYLLWGRTAPGEIFERCLAVGVAEVVLKRGPQPVLVMQRSAGTAVGEQASVPVPPVAKVIDTTAAGDSFNAGYLAARMRGASAAEAAETGSRCASIVISHRGAIVGRETFCSAMADWI